MENLKKRPGSVPHRPQPTSQFGALNATSLYCPKCKAAMPVAERLLLILPDGELYEYRCRRCGTSLGERKVTKKPEPFLIR
jgi:C4-type Zn-finger protein